MTLTMPGLIVLIIIAAVCGAVGKALAGGSQGGLIASIALGFDDRPHRLTVGPIEHVEPRLLGRLRDRFDLTAVHRDVGEDRGARARG